MSSSDGSWISCCHRGDVLELGWPVDIVVGAISIPELPGAAQSRMGSPVGCKLLGQSGSAVVYDGSHGRLPCGWGCGLVSPGVQWH